MATVYLAEDVRHHRLVAIKVLRPGLAALLGAERFLREIRLTAGLDHPHILALYDSGAAGESRTDSPSTLDFRPSTLYYVMPYVEGESLRDRLTREKQLPVDEALRIAREVGDALAYAHARGVVHRDIKPENILLSGGHARVADFGIARAIDLAGGSSLTDTGVTLGTPSYMSPEQAAGEKNLDGRSDIYALGCVVYEMLGGQPPFTGPTVESVIHQHIVAEAMPVTRLRPAVSEVVAETIQRSLAKVPADRPLTAAEFVHALEPVRTGGYTTSGARRAAANRRRWWLAAGGVGVLAIGGLAVAALVLSRRPAPPLQLGRRVQVTLDPGLELDPAMSPDGKFVAYSEADGALMVRQVEGGVPIKVVRDGDPRGRWPVWGPGGQSLVYVSPRGIETVAAFGGSPRFLAAATPQRGVALAPDGKTFAYVRHDSLMAAPVAGGASRFVTTAREIHSPAWSPDGRRIAFVSGDIQFISQTDLGNIANSSIEVAPASGGPPVAVTDAHSLNVSPAWASAHTLLFVSNRDGGRDIYQIGVDRSGAPEETAVRLTIGLNPHSVGIAADGSRFAYSAFTETSNVWVVPIPANGSVSIDDARPLTRGNQIMENIGVSPDGKWLGFSSDRNGIFQLYRQRLGDPGAEPIQVTIDTAGAWWIGWSPDSKEIGFHRFRGEKRAVFTIPAEGGSPTQITDGSQDERSPEWSPDGKQLLLLANWGVRPELDLVTRGADGKWGSPQILPVVLDGDTVPAGLGAWSPDGKWIACGCGPGGIALVPAGGGPAHRLKSPFSTVGWDFPQWSADGRTVYHLMEDSGRTVAAVAVPLDGARPRVVLRFDDPMRPWARFGFKVHGNQIYTEVGDRQSDIWVVGLQKAR